MKTKKQKAAAAACSKKWRLNNPEKDRKNQKKYRDKTRLIKQKKEWQASTFSEEKEWNETLIELGYSDLY